ncbi:hypothetical protein DQ04_01141000 [Trypanosoma grayi]|uniref:hypothetical protein n=1 Tax=Trypanosoma grayi TaxID=71804 RepID=UPI0004F4A057|nr:hypothetical protein DQ04_01141000 [Trypanosoma grayi]KEG13214.1 hypothetical protein DQ04_01141000 [Trypanosoma grayi]
MEARTRQEEPLIARGVFALGSEGESEDGGNEVKDDGCSDGSYGNLEEEEIPTTQMVKAWNAEVIPPERMGHAMVSSAGFVDARERLSLLDARLAEAARERESRRRRGKQRPVDFRAATRGGTRRKGGAVLPRSLLPDTVSRDEAHRKEPKRMIDYKLRNEKIEMLRCLRFIDDLQKEVRRNMVQRHSDATRQLREDMRHALQRDRQEKMEHQRLIKEEDQKYRNAYAAIMTAACNDRRIAKDLMLERTRQLAEYQSLSLRESRRMCHYMKQESKERMRHDLLHYVSTITGWQSHFVS